jgi:LuxR family transcriptional regulator, quorum-sensing system regulator BjaR1
VEGEVDATFSEQVLDHSHRAVTAPGLTLSRREQEALQWAAEGKTEWEIGTILGLSEHTAEKFIRSACSKLHASNRTHAVARAIRLGLIA